MGRKRGFIIVTFFVIIIFLFSFISCSATGKLEEGIEKVENIRDGIERAQDVKYWEEKWDYLGNEWKEIFLKNRGMAALDGFFNKISFIFKIFFGVPYSFSLVFLFVFFLWIYFYFHISDFFSLTGFLEKGVSYLAGLVICVVLAQLRFFEVVVLFIGRLIFSPEYILTRILFFFLFIVALGVSSFLNKKVGKYIKLKRKTAKEKNLEISQKATASFVEGFRKTSSE